MREDGEPITITKRGYAVAVFTPTHRWYWFVGQFEGSSMAYSV